MPSQLFPTSRTLLSALGDDDTTAPFAPATIPAATIAVARLADTRNRGSDTTASTIASDIARSVSRPGEATAQAS